MLVNTLYYMGVSLNGGTPKWMVKIMENPIKMGDLGGKPTIFGNIHMDSSAVFNPSYLVNRVFPSLFFFHGATSSLLMQKNIPVVEEMLPLRAQKSHSHEVGSLSHYLRQVYHHPRCLFGFFFHQQYCNQYLPGKRRNIP